MNRPFQPFTHPNKDCEKQGYPMSGKKKKLYIKLTKLWEFDGDDSAMKNINLVKPILNYSHRRQLAVRSILSEQ